MSCTPLLLCVSDSAKPAVRWSTRPSTLGLPSSCPRMKMLSTVASILQNCPTPISPLVHKSPRAAPILPIPHLPQTLDIPLPLDPSSFTRLNVLHLWELVEHDLISLGVKILDPSVFSSVDFQHVGTSQLQHSLLKIALLLGVRVELGSPITELQAMLTLSSRPSSREGEVTGNGEDKSPVDRNEFEVLVDATGARCDLFSSIGLSQEVVFKGEATGWKEKGAGWWDCRE